MKYYKIISIGHSCVPAFQIRKWLHQSEAYFFDWLVVPSPALIALLRTGPMELFVDQAKLEAAGSHEGNTIVVHKDLNVRFYHDFGEQYDLADFPIVRDKYRFLADRWLELVNGAKLILFLRHHIKESECVEIQRKIQATYPGLDFEILAVNECAGRDWGRAGIHNKYIRSGPVWHGDDGEWWRVLEETTS